MAIVDVPPARDGYVDRVGARLYYQQFGETGPALLLLPTWSIVHSDFWWRQVPHFQDRYRVITFDGRGNGRSSRPRTAADYADDVFAADALAVMDELGVQSATLMAVSAGAAWQLILAAGHTARVEACVFIGASLPLGTPLPERAAALQHFNEPQENYDGWLKFNRHYWHDAWQDFLEFFFSKCFTEPDSEAEIAHFVSMGLETDAKTILLTAEAPGLDRERATSLAQGLRCPTLVIHGDHDAISSVTRSEELAAHARAQLIVMPGVGHEPQCRWPTEVNTILDLFLTEHVLP